MEGQGGTMPSPQAQPEVCPVWTLWMGVRAGLVTSLAVTE